MLDILSPKDVCLLIRLEWDKIFKQYFDGKNFDVWKEKFDSYIFARNPLAHNLKNFLDENEVSKTNIHCKEILDAVKNYEKKVGFESAKIPSAEKNLAADKKIVNNQAVVDKKIVGNIVLLRELEYNDKRKNVRGILEIQNKKYPGVILKKYLDKNFKIPQSGEVNAEIVHVDEQANVYHLRLAEINSKP